MTFDMIEAIASLIRYPLNKWSCVLLSFHPKISLTICITKPQFSSPLPVYLRNFFFFPVHLRHSRLCHPKKKITVFQKSCIPSYKKKDPSICWKIKISFFLRSCIWSQLPIGRIKAQPSHMNRFNPLTQVYLHDPKKNREFQHPVFYDIANLLSSPVTKDCSYELIFFFSAVQSTAISDHRAGSINHPCLDWNNRQAGKQKQKRERERDCH